MASWQVELRSGSGRVATIDLIDVFGPLNDWMDQTPGAFDPSLGTFTNQFRIVKPSIQPSWMSNEFDIDKVKVGSTGLAEAFDSGTDFPNGNMPWVAVAKL